MQVVLNKAISKTQKVRFFTPAVLSSLASLYKWNGIVDATTEDESVSFLFPFNQNVCDLDFSLNCCVGIFLFYVRWKTRSRMGAQLSASSSTVSFSTCVLLVNMALAFMMLTLEQLAGM